MQNTCNTLCYRNYLNIHVSEIHILQFRAITYNQSNIEAEYRLRYCAMSQ